MLRELGLDGKFIPNGPERPALGREQHPEKTLENSPKPLTMPNKSAKEVGFQSTCNSSLQQLHANWARGQVKKI
jgi:hypothetical protein